MLSRSGLSTTLRGIAMAGALVMLPAFADEVDDAVDAVAMAGSIAGVSVGENEKTVIKGLVRCAISDKAIPDSVLDCAREAIVRTLPAEARPLARCMIRGSTLQRCAEQEALRRVPPKSQAIMTCLANGSPAQQCGADEILRRLPPQARDMASCIAQRKDFGQCADRAGNDIAQKQAFGMLAKLKADGRSGIGEESSGAIRNIIGVVKGLREDDWASVLRYGGPEVYKAAAKIVLNVLLPGFGPVIDSVTEAVVQSRVDLVEGLVKAAKSGDQRKITELSVEFFLVMNVIPPCALVPPGAFKEATCGNIGKAVKVLAETGGDVADFAVNRVVDALDLVGIDTG